MRKLFLLQGAPGSGKSTFIEQHGLAPWTISSDALRLQFRSPELHANGHLTISCSEDSSVWSTLHAMVASRLHKGDLTIVDATHTKRQEIEAYFAVASRHRYETFVITWRDRPLAEILHHNTARDALRWVPESVVREMHTRASQRDMPEWVKLITPDAFDQATQDPIIDTALYRRIHIIGDLQGHASAIESYLASGLAPDELYIFVGNLLVGGPDTARVFNLLMAWSEQPQVRICESNNDRFLRAWCRGSSSGSVDFESLTRPQLEAARVSRDVATKLLAAMSEAVLLSWQGRRVLISHAGLSTLPAMNRLTYIPSSQFIQGIGDRSTDIDMLFARHAPVEALQFHGCRNAAGHPIAATKNSYNLYGGDGKTLRIATLEADGRILTHEIA